MRHGFGRSAELTYIVVQENGTAYWLDGATLLCCPLYADGLPDWEAAVEPDISRISQRDADIARVISDALRGLAVLR